MFQAATHFAPSARVDSDRLARQVELLAKTKFTSDILDAIPDPLLILNQQRQIVLANQAATALIGNDESVLLGMRPGEALLCEHAWDCAGGCGTAEACRACGLVQAVLDSFDNKVVAAECSFIQQIDDQRRAFDLRATVRPINQEHESFSLVILKDIGHEKRRIALEKIFFHDLMNSIGSVRGLIDLVRHYKPADHAELLSLANLATLQAIDEIEAQRQLVMAENGELVPKPGLFSVVELIHEMIGILDKHELTAVKFLEFRKTDTEVYVSTDRVLLRRIILNMLKNALEGISKGEKVTISCTETGNSIRVDVHNPGLIAENHRFHIFHRSFSTKGIGRGLGTYSMRLLAGHLKGTVNFTTDSRAGTTFSLSFPQRID